MIKHLKVMKSFVHATGWIVTILGVFALIVCGLEYLNSILPQWWGLAAIGGLVLAGIYAWVYEWQNTDFDEDIWP